MEPVNHLSRIVDMLRRQASDAASKVGQKSKAGKEAAGAQRPSVQELEQQIGEKIRKLDPNKPDHKQRATRVFVESVLAWEFGDRVMNDPRFFTLVEYVQSAMQSDTSTDATIQAMLDDMRV